jgi:catechol 2,3-dioxygenase-like lactoylglutathione lyase family enzyme
MNERAVAPRRRAAHHSRVLTDAWDITHMCVAVPDLEAGMEQFAGALGLEWGPVADFSSEHFPLASDLIEGPVAVDGLRAVWARNAHPPLELMHTQAGSPATVVWGCPDGREYVHHVCYWVDDLEAESRHLVENGFGVELTMAGGNPTRGFAYHRGPTGFRLELMRAQDKAAMARWLETGELQLDW